MRRNVEILLPRTGTNVSKFATRRGVPLSPNTNEVSSITRQPPLTRRSVVGSDFTARQGVPLSPDTHGVRRVLPLRTYSTAPVKKAIKARRPGNAIQPNEFRTKDKPLRTYSTVPVKN